MAHTESGLLVQAAKNLALGIVGVIYLIMMFILYIQMIKRSAELLVLRLGFARVTFCMAKNINLMPSERIKNPRK